MSSAYISLNVMCEKVVDSVLAIKRNISLLCMFVRHHMFQWGNTLSTHNVLKSGRKYKKRERERRESEITPDFPTTTITRAIK